ncbi:DUF1700 domain-containing protein [Brevundimonas sp. 2R-24]|uniref:DUF1700 domain-containing protein n=1 Tax=Peiella sedimenti TaxID=3061083 RepID=A0ABT8SHN4_9CAUL|nr:DUF1700 domain-containing protein [Caulobacteraceae bacterium XZ-24]
MTRAEFLTRLRRGLAGHPASAIDDIVADYERHFDEAAAAGRSETEVAEALGNPERLARELRTEASLRRWSEEKSVSSAASALIALLALGALDIIVLLPLLMSILGVLFGLFVAVVAVFFAGGVVMVGGPFTAPPGGPFTAVLIGLGLMAAAASVGAILTVVAIGLFNALVWFGRLHYRLLKPALAQGDDQ